MAMITTKQINDHYKQHGFLPQGMPIQVLTSALGKAGLPVNTRIQQSNRGYGVYDLPAGMKASHIVDALKDYVVAGHHLNKALRPWEVDTKFFDNLDPAQPWWGFEMETGWNGREARAAACIWTWDNCRGVTYDGEGEGDYRVEITFQADNVSNYAKGSADAVKFMEWVEENKKLVYYNPALVNVGTHWNVSLPEFRFDRNLAQKVAGFLANTVQLLYKKDKKGLDHLGRTVPFGMFHVQGYGRPGQACWIEFKGFRTTYTVAGFKHYLKVCDALQQGVYAFIEHLKQNPRADYAYLGCENITAVIEKGAKPSIGKVAIYDGGLR